MNDDRVQCMVNTLKKLESDRYEFGIKHEFARKRPQDYKNCVVIRWKHRKRKNKDFIDYERIEEYVVLCHEITDKYQLRDEENSWLEFSLRAFKAGIYVSTHWDFHVWAIPNEFQEIQEFVLSKIPAWAVVTRRS